MSRGEALRAARRTAAIFALADRGLVEVRGGDRVRFLHGQLSNDVAGLAAEGPRSGCYALLLTAQGRIVADVHVLARPEAFWLETAGSSVPAVIARLEKYVIADDVRLADRSADWARFGIEGPVARALLAAGAGAAPELLPDAVAPLGIGGAECYAAAFGWSGEDAVQILAPAAARESVADALRVAAGSVGAVWADAEALETLRVEAGVPRAGAELGEEVLPAEARLVERAVSFTKGCYTGQEVVARMQSRGRVGHLLVGLALPAGAGGLPARGSALLLDGARVGEITSAVSSPARGPIALGFVRAAHAEPGTALACEAGPARVVDLPFVPLRAHGPGRG